MLTSRVIDGFVLAHEDNCNPLCELAKDPFGGVDMMPYACVGQRSL